MRYGREGDGPRFAIVAGVLVALVTVGIGLGVAAVTWLLDDDPRGGHGALALLSVPLGLVLGTLAQWLAVLRRR